MKQLESTISNLLGVDHVTLQHFASGDLSSLMSVVTPDSRQFIAKGGPAPALEGEMLRLIRATGAPAPEVIAADDRILIIEQVDGRSGFSSAQADLGKALSTLHSATGKRFGFSKNYAFGRVVIENDESDSWVSFWRDHRLLNHIDALPSDLGKRLENLADGLADIIPDTPPAALLHGDLWSGNVMSLSGKISAFIDPASYYGHAEVDLAMLNLFGRLDRIFYANYPALEPGYEERQAVYSLWPALVHLRLFGSGYRSMVDGFLSRCGY